MHTYTFGRCIELLDVDAKVFRRWVREDLKLSEKDQKSKADSRVRYLTEEQLKQLATLHEKTLPPDDQLPGEVEASSPGAYKLLDDRLTTIESLHVQLEHNVSAATGDRETLLERLREDEQRLAQSDEHSKELHSLREHITSLESQLQILPMLMERLTALEAQVQDVPTLTEHLTTLEAQLKTVQPLVTPPDEQRVAEIEASYQQRIKELEEQLAAYQQITQPTKPPLKAPAKRKKKVSIKKLPATLVGRRAFADLHSVPDSIAANACKSGKIAAVQGKWLYQKRVIYQALGDRGKHDFYQLYHQRPDFTACDHCPHEIQERETNSL